MNSSENVIAPRPWRELALLIVAWLVLAAVTASLAKQNLRIPGLYYDEAIFAGMARDFVTGHIHGEHMPDHTVINFLGRPFPIFIQTYLGALESWMLMPAFSLFGSTVPVLRSTKIFWGLIALLFFMLGARRWLGLPTALLAGALLAFDPTYFFLCVLDWGAAVPSFLCRCAGFYFAVLWSQRGKARDGFFAGLFAGLGFFNKADFAVLLVCVGTAAFFCYRRQLFALTRTCPAGLAASCFGLLIGAGPMLLKIPRMFMLTVSGPHPSAPGELRVKLHTLLAMYDSSYFYRLMNVGGVFERMYQQPAAARAGLGIAWVIACLVFVGLKRRKDPDKHKQRAVSFLVLATLLITLGVILVPDAVRIHHAVLVFPWPHLIIATVAAALWQRAAAMRINGRLTRALVLLAVLTLLLSQLRVVQKTQQLISETGGRGRWSESFDAFCREIRNRADLTIVSLDWGFNEQLIFLTDGPQLREAFWNFNQTLSLLPTDPDYVYLVHPPEYSAFRYDTAYLKKARDAGENVEVAPHFDRQKDVAFYTIRFLRR